jgi:hypothetical protein
MRINVKTDTKKQDIDCKYKYGPPIHRRILMSLGGKKKFNQEKRLYIFIHGILGGTMCYVQGVTKSPSTICLALALEGAS